MAIASRMSALESSTASPPTAVGALSFSARSFRASIRAGQAVSALILVVGSVALAGKVFSLSKHGVGFTSFGSMKASAALCFALCGAALLIGYFSYPRPWKRTCAFLLALLVLLISGETLVEYITRHSFQIFPTSHPLAEGSQP
jgi:hypothetical protein